MGDNRVLEILKQVEAGDITPEEADRILAGAGAPAAPAAPAPPAPPSARRWDEKFERLDRAHSRHLDRMERHRERLDRRVAHQRERWARRRFEGRISVDDLIRLRLHGIHAEYVEEMREQLGDIPLDKLIELKVHGVTPEMVEELRESGVEDVSPDDVLRWKTAVQGSSRFNAAMGSAMEVVGPYVNQLVEASLQEARHRIYEALKVNPAPPESWKSVDTAAAAEPEKKAKDKGKADE